MPLPLPALPLPALPLPALPLPALPLPYMQPKRQVAQTVFGDAAISMGVMGVMMAMSDGRLSQVMFVNIWHQYCTHTENNHKEVSDHTMRTRNVHVGLDMLVVLVDMDRDGA